VTTPPLAQAAAGPTAGSPFGPAWPSDVELVARCRNGDTSAWDLLVRRYERLVFSVALRNGLSQEDAADVCQTTFVALLETITSLREGEQLASWLMTVSRRQAWRVRRRREREQISALPPESSYDPWGDWDRVTAVHEALSRLADPCRDLLVALYFDPASPSYAVLAKRLGRSIGGIGPMRGRCLERLRALLDEPADP
jgi:RNA polymerase sigma factor (sigma-70 family)